MACGSREGRLVNKEKFTVDAALLQELGERLIGRAHIALAELIKNSYDADAIDCHIRFEDDQIMITDDGHGMSQEEFLEHWMRIGTTHKVELENSRNLKRALTGSKGVGRLSAQFLASEMILESTSIDRPDKTLYAIVDWTNIRRGRDLDTVEVEWEMRTESPRYPNDWPTGTRISLKILKTEWDTASLEDLGRDIWVLRSPFKPSTRLPGSRNRDDFHVEIEAPEIRGAHEAFDKMRTNLFANWRARIRGSLDRGRLHGKANVTVEFDEGYPEGISTATSFSETIMLPIRSEGGLDEPLIDRLSLDILVFKPEGRQAGGVSVGEMRDYLARYGNVSVYDAGFRLPYYGSSGEKSGQDWLNIAIDQGRRLNASELLPDRLKTPTRYMQDLPAPGRLFGAVEIDTNHERSMAEKSDVSAGRWLQIQSSRDRLHDNFAFLQLRDFVRFALDFYANRYRTLSLQASEAGRDKEPPARKFERALNILDCSKDEIPAKIFKEVREEIVDARTASTAEEEALDRRAVLLAPLATAGMAALALSHELARESRLLGRASENLHRLARKYSAPELEEVAKDFDKAFQRFDALQELFLPLLSEADAVATDRLRVRPIIREVVRSMRPLLPRVTFDLRGVSDSIWFPMGSFAEWNAVLQNVLSNAWNAMLDTESAKISFEADRRPSGREWLRVSDTGRGLGLIPEEASHLFDPFERLLEINPDNRSIAIGGSGLGLTIVRMIAHRRKATVRFVKPLPGFSTTFEMSWQGAKK